MVARRTTLAACTAILLVSPGPAFAEPGPPHRWKTLEIPGKAPNTYTVQPDGVIAVESRAAVSILYKELDIEDRQGHRLTWRWLVERSVPATDLGRRGADDRDLAVHVWFSEGGETAGWPRRVYAWALGAIGFPPIGRTLTYVWGGAAERGDRLANPHPETEGAIIVLRPSGTEENRWFSEAVDVVADYRRAFGEPAPPPKFIAVSTDSDDTGSVSLGRIADLKLTVAPGRPRTLSDAR